MHIGIHRSHRKQHILLCGMLIIPAIVIFTPAESPGQWSHLATHIFNSSPGSSGGAIHFKNGILWAGLREILCSRDSGKTWTVSLPSMVGGELVMNIDFFDNTTGLCRTPNHLYITKDGGLSWSEQPAPGSSGSRYSIFAGAATNIISLAQNGIYVSNDGGGTWTKKYTGLNPNVAAYKDGGTVAVYEASASRLVISHDYGQTWQAKPIDPNIADSYSLDWDKCDPSLLYLTNEDYFAHNQNRSEIFATANEGDSWVSLIQKPYGFFNGGMSISRSAAYFQTLNYGIIATMDKGITWDSINGPSNYADTRWLTSINTGILIAVDQNGDVWRYGTGSLGATPLFTAPEKLEITNCLRDSLTAAIKGIRCRNFSVENAFVTGPDSAFYSLNSSASYPFPINEFSHADFLIGFDPQHKTGSFNDTLHIQWKDDDGGSIQDTTFVLSADVISAFAAVASPQVLVFDTVSPCRPGLDTLVTVTNRGCDTISIQNQPTLYSSEFAFDSLNLPVILPPDSSVNIVYHFHPSVPGNYQTFSQIVLDDNGILQRLSVMLSASAQATDFTGVGLDSVMEMDAVSSCSPYKDTTITIANIGCVPLRITRNAAISGAGFSFDSVTYPLFIPSDSSATFRIHFLPPTTGDYSEHFRFNADWNGFGSRPLDFYMHGLCTASKVGPVVLDTTVDFGSASMCQPLRDTSIDFTNRGCDTMTIVSRSAIFGKGFTLDHRTLPVNLPPDSSMTVSFHFRPGLPGKYQASVKFATLRKGVDGEVALLIAGRLNKSIAPSPMPYRNIDLGSVTSCDERRDTIVTFTNFACDTLNILSGPGQLSTGFTMEPLQLPIALPPDSSVNVVFHFHPPDIGNFITFPHFEFEREDEFENVDLLIKGDAVPGRSVFSVLTPSVAFVPISICRTDSAEIVCSNTGCDTLYVKPVGISGDADFLGFAGNERALGSGDTMHVPVRLVPAFKGNRSAAFHLHCRHRSGETSDTSIAISATVTDGLKVLAASIPSIDFPTTRLCAAPDSTLLLMNRGCDTLIISDALINGSGFVISGDTLPIVLPPGEGTTLRVQTVLDTIGNKPASQAMLTFSSTSNEPLAPISLTHGYRYPTNYPIRLAGGNDGVKAGDIFVLRILADSVPDDIFRIDAKLSIEHPDLLTYLSSQSSHTVSVHGDSITIVGNPVIAPNHILAELYYRVYLARDSTTDLTLSDIHFNSSDNDYEQCMALSTSVAQTGFHYGYECGDKTIMLAMNGQLSAKVFSLRPNPTSGKIHIDLKTLNDEDVDLAIVDAKGSTIHREVRHHPKGRSDVPLDLSGISSGSYIIRITASGAKLAMPFVIEK
ncbi:MAG: T9SS type A sorting domain-containing protein [Bacteroidota bacterium]|nr:T9SS type A sorting domain-containing protein [Bacteroidota bacterium]